MVGYSVALSFLMKRFQDRVFMVFGLSFFLLGTFLTIGFEGDDQYSLAKYIIGYIFVFIGSVATEASTQAICSKAVSQQCTESYWNPGMWLGIADTLGRSTGNFGVFIVALQGTLLCVFDSSSCF